MQDKGQETPEEVVTLSIYLSIKDVIEKDIYKEKARIGKALLELYPEKASQDKVNIRFIWY